MDLILASESPRRRMLLSYLGYSYQSFAPAIDESIDESDIDASVINLARTKALSATRVFKSGLAIGCDTIVQLGPRHFGKPRDKADAMSILNQLSGQTHIVKSGLALVDLASGRSITGIEQTAVMFRPLGAAEIERYLAGPEAYDKAGAYGLQGEGGVFIKNISGCLNNVIGFPVTLFLKLMQDTEAW